MSKKFYRICLCIILAMLLTAGCTSPAGPNPNASTPTETTPVATEPLATEPPETEPIETEPPVTEPKIYEEVDEVVYATNPVNVRLGPGTEYDRIAELKAGQAIRRVAIGTNGWSKVVLDDADVYVSSKYLSTEMPTNINEPLPAAKETVYALQDVNVRSGPGTSYDKVGGLKEGTAIKRVSIGTDGWDKVIYKDQLCYVSSKYLVKEMPQHSEPSPAPTQPKPVTPPKETKPSGNNSGSETPPESEQTHEHKYSAGKTVAPTCTVDGYTFYSCSCGSCYRGDEVSATGHSWSGWTVTEEATTSAAGEKVRTCGTCQATETDTIPKKAEEIDAFALASYGNSYAASLGFTVDSGVRDGYFPPDTIRFTGMSAAKSNVADNVDVLYNNIIARDGSVDGYRACTTVSDNGDGSYTVTVYYG